MVSFCMTTNMFSLSVLQCWHSISTCFSSALLLRWNSDIAFKVCCMAYSAELRLYFSQLQQYYFLWEKNKKKKSTQIWNGSEWRNCAVLPKSASTLRLHPCTHRLRFCCKTCAHLSMVLTFLRFSAIFHSFWGIGL